MAMIRVDLNGMCISYLSSFCIHFQTCSYRSSSLGLCSRKQIHNVSNSAWTSKLCPSKFSNYELICSISGHDDDKLRPGLSSKPSIG